MSRRTAPRLVMVTLIVAAAVPFAVTGAQAADPLEHEILIHDTPDLRFEPGSVEIMRGEKVTWKLHPSSTAVHSIALDANNDGDIDQQDQFSGDLAPGTDSKFSWTFDQASPGNPYTFVCLKHLMTGTVRVKEPAPPPTTTTTAPPTTTTTTQPPATTTTTAPPPTTATTRPPATTTTTRRAPAPTTTTQPPASASSGTPSTTTTTARATTTTGKATTSTTDKKKPTTTTATAAPAAPDTTTTSALSAEWIPTPDMVPDGSPTTTTTAPEMQAAASPRRGGKGGGGGGLPAAGALALAVLALGGAGWAWYHRSSRYLPA